MRGCENIKKVKEVNQFQILLISGEIPAFAGMTVNFEQVPAFAGMTFNFEGMLAEQSGSGKWF